MFGLGQKFPVFAVVRGLSLPSTDGSLSKAVILALFLLARKFGLKWFSIRYKVRVWW